MDDESKVLWLVNHKNNDVTIHSIYVDSGMSDMEVDSNTNMTYLTSLSSNKLYFVDESIYSLVVGLDFISEPSNGGTIRCNNEDIKFGSSFYSLGSNAKCAAHPNVGFRFHNWEVGENVYESHTIEIKVDGFKTLTANFSEIVPSMYWITLSVIAAILLLFIVISARDKKYKKYLAKLDDVYNEIPVDVRDCTSMLLETKANLLADLNGRRISESDFISVFKKLSAYAKKINVEIP